MLGAITLRVVPRVALQTPRQPAVAATVLGVARPLLLKASACTATHPCAAGMFFAGTQMCAADLLVQMVVEKKNEIDVRRNMVFSVLGVGWFGGFQYFLYNCCFPRWFPSTGLRAVISKVAFDQTINSGLWYYPTFYVVQDAIMTGRFTNDAVRDGSTRYAANIKDDMIRCWKVWVPAQIINFSIVPAHLTVPFVGTISFIMTILISLARGDPEDLTA